MDEKHYSSVYYYYYYYHYYYCYYYYFIIKGEIKSSREEAALHLAQSCHYRHMKGGKNRAPL